MPKEPTPAMPSTAATRKWLERAGISLHSADGSYEQPA